MYATGYKQELWHDVKHLEEYSREHPEPNRILWRQVTFIVSIKNNIPAISWLSNNRDEGFSVATMNYAAYYGKLKMVKWLHYNRTESGDSFAMQFAIERKHFDVAKFLYENVPSCLDETLFNLAKAINSMDEDNRKWFTERETRKLLLGQWKKFETVK